VLDVGQEAARPTVNPAPAAAGAGQHKVQQLLTMELQLGPRLANEIIKALTGGRKDVALDEASMRAGITTDPWQYLSQFRAAGWK
jgi:hypothetical protein